MVIIDYFTKLEKDFEGKLYIKKSKWFNGHCYLPLLSFDLSLNNEFFKLNIKYEFRQSEFSNSSIVAGGAYKDRHICSIKCYIENENIPSFRIVERSLINRVLKKNDKPNYRLKCGGSDFKIILYQSVFLSNVYEIVENSAEFRPLIQGVKNEELFVVEIDYNISKFNNKVLDNLISTCDLISKYGMRSKV